MGALEGFSVGDSGSASTALKGFTIGAQEPSDAPKALGGFSLTLPKDNSFSKMAPAPAAIALPKPPDTSSLFSKFISGISGSITKAITPPSTGNGTDTRIVPSAAQYLPSELARAIPGVADLQDDPSLSQYITPKEVLGSVPSALADVAKGIIKMPITALADVRDLGNQAMGRAPDTEWDIPGLGKITSNQLSVSRRIMQGQDPLSATLAEGSNAIFNTLFLADVINRVAGPNVAPVAKTQGNVSDLPSQTSKGGSAVDTGPKTGRLYEAPTAYSKSPILIPKETLDSMEAQGTKFGTAFDPAQPVFFKVTVGKGGAYTGEILQLKPSYLELAYKKIFGTPPPTDTLPALLGGKTDIASSFSPAELSSVADAAKESDTVTLHSKTVNGGEVVKSVHDAVSSTQLPEATAPKPLALPPPTSQVIAHNALRLAGGDTAKANGIAATLVTETKTAIAEHGPDVARQAAIEKIGLSPQQADLLVKEAQTPTTPAEIKAGHEKILAKLNLGADEVQSTKSSNPQPAGREPDFKESPKYKNAEEFVEKTQTIFHGTKAGIKSIKELSPLAYANPHALYGPGVYVTDHEEIAKGYAKTRGNGPEGKVLSGKIESGTKLLDLDKKLPNSLISLFEKTINRARGDLEEGNEKISGLTGREAIKILQDSLSEAHIPSYEGAEEFFQLQQQLSEEHGYRGFLHRGGINKGKEHNVAILFDYGDANQSLPVTDSSIPKEPKPAPVKPKKIKPQTSRGFIAPAAMVEQANEAIATLRNTIKEIEKLNELSGNVRNAGYQLQGQRSANRVRLIQLVEKVGNMLDAQGWEHLYHHDENSDEKLTKMEQEIYDAVILPIKEAITKARSEYRALGGTITADLQPEGFTPRFTKEKGGPFDEIIDSAKRGIKKYIKNGALLSKSLGPGSKRREFHVAVNDAGERTVVHIPSGKSAKVTAFKAGKLSELGTINRQSRASLVNEEIRPLQKQIRDIQNDIDLLEAKNTGRQPVSQQRLDSLGADIDNLVEFVKDKTGEITKRQVAGKMRAIRDKSIEYNALADVKRSADQKIIDNTERLSTLKSQMLDLVNSVGDIESKYNPDQLLERVFQDKEGNQYKIQQATTKEIEANTSVRYHKNALANYIVTYDRTLGALGAMRLLERIKNEEEFGDIIHKDTPDEAPPEGWKSIGDKLPQFRGYHFEPRTAEALEDLASRQQGQVYIPIFDELNNLLISAIVLNPIMHVPNVLAGRGLAAATGGVPTKTLLNLRRAINEVREKGPLYLSLLEHGAPLMHLKETTKKFSDAILNQYTQEMENNPKEHEATALALGFKTAKQWGHNLNKLNEDITWGSNDVFYVHAYIDYMEGHPGTTMEGAIKEVSKRMADYRIPERVFLPGQTGRILSLGLQSRLFMFGRYHYSGVLKPWIEAAKESAKGDLKGPRALAYLFLMGLLIYPFMNKMWKGITGSPTTYMTMAGPVRPIQVAGKFFQGGSEGLPTTMQALFTPSPALKSSIELGFNVDLFTRNPIYGQPPAEGLTTYGTSIVSPLASASRMTPGDFALSLFGIWTPKNVPGKTTLNNMKYEELPALQVEVKKDIINGEQDKADAAMAEFNSRAIATWNQYQIQISGTQFVTTEEEKQAFLKEWGIKQPGDKALSNAAVLYNDGALTSKASLTDNVAVYAKALGVDPAIAFERIFTGQRIVRVSHFGFFNPDSAIIVERMPESASGAVRTERNATDEQVLDHVIPLEAGGSNDKGNLNLIPAANNVGEQHVFENFLGASVKSGIVSRAKVREYSIRYKIGQGETLPPAYMQEFKDKYGAKTISLQEVEDEINGGKAK